MEKLAAQRESTEKNKGNKYFKGWLSAILRLSGKGYFLGNFLFYQNLNTNFIGSLLLGLLISAPGTRFPRGGPGASSALWRLWGLQ
jgi:hypothetical protein